MTAFGLLRIIASSAHSSGVPRQHLGGKMVHERQEKPFPLGVVQTCLLQTLSGYTLGSFPPPNPFQKGKHSRGTSICSSSVTLDLTLHSLLTPQAQPTRWRDHPAQNFSASARLTLWAGPFSVAGPSCAS